MSLILHDHPETYVARLPVGMIFLGSRMGLAIPWYAGLGVKQLRRAWGELSLQGFQSRRIWKGLRNVQTNSRRIIWCLVPYMVVSPMRVGACSTPTNHNRSLERFARLVLMGILIDWKSTVQPDSQVSELLINYESRHLRNSPSLLGHFAGFQR